jgi:transposase
MLHDDCLGRMLDWLHDHDPTTLFAGIARQARQRFGIPARQVHVDTTSFAVTGEYDTDRDAHTLAVTYGYSRDHRADLKQWLLALATTRAGDVPLFCQALDGNASDKVSLPAAVEALAEQLRPPTRARTPRTAKTRRCRSSWRIAACIVSTMSPALRRPACVG